MSENHILTPDEALALPDGAEVYVEMYGAKLGVLNGVHTKVGSEVEDSFGPLTIGGIGHSAGLFRFWVLPQPPTPEERAANPWPKGRRSR